MRCPRATREGYKRRGLGVGCTGPPRIRANAPPPSVPRELLTTNQRPKRILESELLPNCQFRSPSHALLEETRIRTPERPRLVHCAPAPGFDDTNYGDLSEDMIWSIHDRETCEATRSTPADQQVDWRTFRAKLVRHEKRKSFGIVSAGSSGGTVHEPLSCGKSGSVGANAVAPKPSPPGDPARASISSHSASVASKAASPPKRKTSGGSTASKSSGLSASCGPTKRPPIRGQDGSSSSSSQQRPKFQLGPGSWAHDLANPEPGCLLLATSSNMQFFNEAVVLITSHDERGSIGFVLNKPSPLRVHELQRLSLGGPVHLDHITLLHRYAGLSNSHKVTEQLYSGGLVDAVKMVQTGLAKPFDFTLALGISAWGANQLSAEISSGCWRAVASSPDLLLPRRSSTSSDMQDERDSGSMYQRIMLDPSRSARAMLTFPS
eukprot:gene32712-3596_t